MTHSLRIVHTSDWHLGHSLHGQSREYEHEAFLTWLLDRLEEERADALLVAGDLFHTSNPSAAALRTFYDFVGTLRARLPSLDLIVIGGNHDSASHLDAPDALFTALGVKVVGGLASTSEGVDADRPLAPIYKHGAIAGWVVAVPFLRPTDLDGALLRDEGHVAAVRHAYAQVLAGALERRAEHQPIVAMGHCTMAGTTVSELSERAIVGGAEALPADLFGPHVAYAALGHLHLAQSVGGREHIRYSGSPIPLSMAEDGYPHQVLVVDLDGASIANVRELRVPRAVPLIRLHTAEPKPLDETLEALRELRVSDRPLEERPFLEVAVRLDRPEPDLRAKVLDALGDTPVRLVKITSHRSDRLGTCLGDVVVDKDLADLAPRDVFVQLHQREHGCEPDDALVRAFTELEQRVQAA